MDRVDYDKEILRQLADVKTYKPVTKGAIPILSIYQQIQILSTQARQHDLITGQIYIFLKEKITPATAKIPQIYTLPKVHKQPLKGRPIVPGKHWITTPASTLVDHLLQPLLKRIPTVIADSKSILVELNQTKFWDPGCRLITADVSSLYTEINTNLGLMCVKTLMSENSDLFPLPLQLLIIGLLTIVMKNNYFQFQGKFYHQIKGTAMGTPAAPVFANIFMYILERNVLKRYADDIRYYKRYLDDIFMIVYRNFEAIKASLSCMEKNIKLEFSDSDHSATFLDITFFKGHRFDSENILDSKVFQKQLNAYLYIPFKSCHQDKTKSGFIITELQRYVRNTSSIEDYLRVKNCFWNHLRARGYPPEFLTKSFSKVWFRDRSKFLLPSPEKEIDSAVYFTTEFTPLAYQLQLKKMFSSHLESIDLKTGIGFKSGQNLGSLICRNKIPESHLHSSTASASK